MDQRYGTEVWNGSFKEVWNGGMERGYGTGVVPELVPDLLFWLAPKWVYKNKNACAWCVAIQITPFLACSDLCPAVPLLERKKFEGFKSRCRTCFSWMYFNANIACANLAHSEYVGRKSRQELKARNVYGSAVVWNWSWVGRLGVPTQYLILCQRLSASLCLRPCRATHFGQMVQLLDQVAIHCTFVECKHENNQELFFWFASVIRAVRSPPSQ